MTMLILTGSLSLSMLDQVSVTLAYFSRASILWATSDFRANKPSDIISTLVSIYDSKELFVKELQVLLAQRLLAITDGNFDREVCTSVRLACNSSERHLIAAKKHRDP